MFTASSLSVENHAKSILSLHKDAATQGTPGFNFNLWSGPNKRRALQTLKQLREFTRLKTDDLLFFFLSLLWVTLWRRFPTTVKHVISN